MVLVLEYSHINILSKLSINSNFITTSPIWQHNERNCKTYCHIHGDMRLQRVKRRLMPIKPYIGDLQNAAHNTDFMMSYKN